MLPVMCRRKGTKRWFKLDTIGSGIDNTSMVGICISTFHETRRPKDAGPTVYQVKQGRKSREFEVTSKQVLNFRARILSRQYQ